MKQVFTLATRTAWPLRQSYFLKGKNTSRELTVLDQVNVDLNTDYILEVAFSHSCKELDMNFDVLAWTGFPLVDPKIASVCDGQQILQATFVMNVNMVTAFSSIVGKEKFLTMDTYCGEKFEGESKTKCTGRSNLFLAKEVASMSHVQCTAEKGAEKRSFSVNLMLNFTNNCLVS